MTTQYPFAPKVLRDYLVVQLPGVRVSTEVPKTMVTPLVTITQVPASGVPNLVLSTRRLIVQCWDSKELDAALLAEKVRGLIFDISRTTRVKWLRQTNIIGEPGRFDDPDTAMPRFQMTVDVLMRALTGTAS